MYISIYYSHISIYVYVYIHICIYIYTHTYDLLNIYTYIYIHIHVKIYIYTNVCLYMYVYIYICIYMYVYIHIRIFFCLWQSVPVCCRAVIYIDCSDVCMNRVRTYKFICRYIYVEITVWFFTYVYIRLSLDCDAVWCSGICIPSAIWEMQYNPLIHSNNCWFLPYPYSARLIPPLSTYNMVPYIFVHIYIFRGKSFLVRLWCRMMQSCLQPPQQCVL